MEKAKTTFVGLSTVALFLFAACSGENMTAEEPTAQQKETPADAIGFDAYLNRTTTRAGRTGNYNTGDLQGTGFGVFAYYGDGDLYSESLVPNFMYNQHVKYDDEHGWGYEPVKYWPNEHGSSAVSMGVDRVSFFAYAPYVGVEPASGILTSYYDNTTGTGGDKYEKLTETGITWLSRNGKGGDPYVRYVGAFDPQKCVDICYGVAKSDFTSSVDGGDGINHIGAGEPYLNVAKPTTDAKIDFLFQHALAKLKVQVDADVDVAGHEESDDYVGDMTRLWIRSITFDGVAPHGFMNMRTGAWYNTVDNTRISKASVTILDGRRDGSEAIADDTYEEPLGLNPMLVQSNEYETTTYTANGVTAYETFKVKDNADPTTTPTGVKRNYKNLFGSGGDGSIMVIPANEQLKITIVYDVETADATLPYYLSDAKTKGSTIENKITKSITMGGSPLKLEAGKAYNINLHLGMNSVTFFAEAANWDSGTNADDTWLPHNTEPVITFGDNSNFKVTATTLTAEFKVVGLTPGHTITASSGSGNITAISPTSATVPDGGEILYTVTLTPNDKVTWVENTITVTDAENSTSTDVTLFQTEKPFVPSCTITAGSTTFDITQGTGSGDAEGEWNGDADIRLYKKTGAGEYIELVGVYGVPDAENEFSFVPDEDNNKVTVTLGAAPASGDKYKIAFGIGDSFVTFMVEVP